MFFEVTQCLPQVARMFRDVDIDNDNVITLDEIAILAKTFERNNKQESKPLALDKNKQDPAASLEESSVNKKTIAFNFLTFQLNSILYDRNNHRL